MDKAQLHGLQFNHSVVIDGDEKLGEIHDSFSEMLHGAYRAAKFWSPYYRQIGSDAVVAGNSKTHN